MKINFWGAARGVTGSKHLIQTADYNLLLDCGLYQGKRNISEQQNRTLPFPADGIDAVILSHAHADHCGVLPLLVKSGFEGKIYCTEATADIAKYILEDSAGIQEQDSIYFNRHITGNETPISPIYTKDDVQETVKHFKRVPYFRASGEWTELNENIRFKFYDAGHILGSAITSLEIKENGAVKNLAFTGDLGRDCLPILRSPERIGEGVETLIMESTYGGEIHRPIEDAINEIKDVVNEAFRRKSKIIVPAFALGRTQGLIYILHKLADRKAIPSLPIYIDSPLAENLTDIFPRYTGDFDDQFWRDFGKRGESPFEFKNLIYVRSADESRGVNEKAGPFMVISASGMAEGGRILHHLKNNIGDPNNMVLITGYQAEDTLGRKIQEGISPVNIFGGAYDVKAKIITINELSAHADQNDFLSYIKPIRGLKKIFLVHGEMPEAEAFKGALGKHYPSLPVEIPAMGQGFDF